MGALTGRSVERVEAAAHLRASGRRRALAWATRTRSWRRRSRLRRCPSSSRPGRGRPGRRTRSGRRETRAATAWGAEGEERARARRTASDGRRAAGVQESGAEGRSGPVEALATTGCEGWRMQWPFGVESACQRPHEPQQRATRRRTKLTALSLDLLRAASGLLPERRREPARRPSGPDSSATARRQGSSRPLRWCGRRLSAVLGCGRDEGSWRGWPGRATEKRVRRRAQRRERLGKRSLEGRRVPSTAEGTQGMVQGWPSEGTPPWAQRKQARPRWAAMQREDLKERRRRRRQQVPGREQRRRVEQRAMPPDAPRSAATAAARAQVGAARPRRPARARPPRTRASGRRARRDRHRAQTTGPTAAAAPGSAGRLRPAQARLRTARRQRRRAVAAGVGQMWPGRQACGSRTERLATPSWQRSSAAGCEGRQPQTG